MAQAAIHPALDSLQELLEVNIDASKFFETAAPLARAPVLKKTLSDQLDQRRRWANELQTRIATANQDPRENGSLRGTLQRGWLDLRDRLRATSDLSLINDVLAGEEEIRRRYEAVRVRLEGPLASLVQRQYEGLLASGRALHTVKRNLQNDRNEGATGA